MQRKPIIILLLVLNTVVLLGQLWPAGAPPFAGAVNIAFLVMSFVFFLTMILKKK